MEVEISDSPARRSRRLTAQIKESLRELNIQLALLNHQVVTHLDLNDTDLHCLEILNRRGPLSPSALARSAGLPNAERKDSQGICFLGRVPINAFLEKFISTRQVR